MFHWSSLGGVLIARTRQLMTILRDFGSGGQPDVFQLSAPVTTNQLVISVPTDHAVVFTG